MMRSAFALSLLYTVASSFPSHYVQSSAALLPSSLNENHGNFGVITSVTIVNLEVTYGDVLYNCPLHREGLSLCLDIGEFYAVQY